MKEQYQRFRIWQKGPHIPSKDGLEEEHRCANCGHEFKGNYCPVCGQNCRDGRITWQSIFRNVMMLWGIDSHSMPYSLWQLIWRPGYFIGEYISGHKQVSYPPVKMLFLVAVFYAIAKQLLGINSNLFLDQLVMQGENLEAFNIAIEWMNKNPGWAMLSMSILMTIPTWFIFRFSPTHTQHTLSEGVFIQLFMSTLMLMVIFASKYIGLFILFVPIYYFIAYRQLFGYSRWGTIWRLLLCFGVWIWTVIVFASIAVIYTMMDDFIPMLVSMMEITFYILAIIAIHILIGYWISKKQYKRRLNK